MTAFSDVQKNPQNAHKYENNEKVKKVMERLTTRLGEAESQPASSGVGPRAGGAEPGQTASKPPQSPPSSSAAPPGGSGGTPSASAAEMDLD